MTHIDDPADVPVYRDADVRDLRYHESQAEDEPYLAVEAVDGGYAITFDLLPAGAQLREGPLEAVRERLHAAVEAVVADDATETTEVSHSLSASLGSVSTFEDEEAARQVAATLAEIVLDRSNWDEGRSGGGSPGSRLRN